MKAQIWLHKLKIAIAEEDMKTLEFILDNIPQFFNEKEAKSALCLFREAKTLLIEAKSEIASSLTQLQKNRAFLESTDARRFGNFDISS